MTPTLHIRLLGEFSLAGEGAPVLTVSSARLQALLAYLLLHRGTPQSRQQMASRFWPDSPEPQARTNLRNLLHLLRQALPHADDFLAFDYATVLWRPGGSFTLDVADFEAAVAAGSLAAAAAIYRGDLLPGCYDDWIVVERERLQQLLVQTLEWLALQLEEDGNYPAAIGYARRRLRCDPLHEAAYCQLMRLYALNGDRAQVAHTFQACAAVLKYELDLGPSQETCQTYANCLKMRSSVGDVAEPAPGLYPKGGLGTIAFPRAARPGGASA